MTPPLPTFGVSAPASENQSLIEFAKDQFGFTTETVSDPNDANAIAVKYAIVPAGKKIESLKPIIDAFRTKPERRRGTATLTTQDSFIAHVNRFAGADTVIFADRASEPPTLTAVYDYNPAGGKNSDAAFGQHRGQYPFPLSEEWEAWREQDEAGMEGALFAQFLEDRLQDVASVDDLQDSTELKTIAELFNGTFASAAKLLELSRSLDINAAISVKQAMTLSSGEISVAYSEVHNDGEGRPIKVPNLFAIAIPIFVDGVKYRIACRLRYRLANSRVTWWYTMIRPDAYLDHAIAESVSAVRTATSRPVLYGSPEA